MKTIGSFPTIHFSGRRFFLATTVVLIAFAAATVGRAQNPSSGSVGPTGPAATWQGTSIAPGGGVNTEAACVDGVNCEVFTLTVTGTQADWAGQRVKVRIDWTSGLNEYDLYIHKDTLGG